jgi:ribonuclease HII
MIEDKIWNLNPNNYIIGSDEVGRGSFAGPIGAAAVRVNYDHIDLLMDVKDSKKLSPKKRNQIYELVKENEIEYSYIERDNKFIDLYGIKLANEKVLEESISSIFQDGDIVYVDHFKISKFNAISLIRGEDNCRPIALASIIAKVLRDNFMIKLSKKYNGYAFDKNKGYGTKEHRLAIKKYGLSDVHRQSFNLMPI